MDPRVFNTIYNSPHPGEFIKETYLNPFNVSQNEIADKLKVARSTFSRLIRGSSSVSPDMAIRLSHILGRRPKSWLAMQAAYDLQSVKDSANWKTLKPFSFSMTKLAH